jgi:hypothetical protein
MCSSAIIVQHVEHVLLRPPLPFKIQQNGGGSELLFDLICCLQYMIVDVFINEQWIMQILTILTVHWWQHRLQQDTPWGQKGNAFIKKRIQV